MRFRAICRGLAAMAVLAAWTGGAEAAHVCGVVLFPAAGSVPSRVRTQFSQTPSCGGTLNTLWFCERTGTSPGCAFQAFRYERSELTALYRSLTEAARTQQVVLPSTATSELGGSPCGAAVEFRQAP